MCTLQSTRDVALYNIFKLKSVSNLYYVQYFVGTLPVNYPLDLRKLIIFLQKLNAHHTSVMNLLFSLTANKEFELLCKNYSVTQPQAHGRFRACVWQAFVCHLASFQNSILVHFVYSSSVNKAFSVAAPHTWNSLPSDVRSCRTVDTFKQHLKTHLFRQS